MILLDYRDRRPIYEQIVERFVELMVTGVMAQDSQMPSVRSMAMELSINPNTIQRAYAELERQGYIYSVKGKGSFVAENRHIMEKRGEEMLAELRDLADRARSLGLEKERLFAVITAAYEEAEHRIARTDGEEQRTNGTPEPSAGPSGSEAGAQRQDERETAEPGGPSGSEAGVQRQDERETAETDGPSGPEAGIQRQDERETAEPDGPSWPEAADGAALREEGERS